MHCFGEETKGGQTKGGTGRLRDSLTEVDMEKSKRRERTPKTREKKQEDNPTKTEGKTRTERRERREAEQR